MKSLNLSRLIFSKNKKVLVIIVIKPTKNIASGTMFSIDKNETISI
ncbi:MULTISPECIES: hypothetical protein [Flavobacterium]|uniref:Uncharacterized protein n=1 Tax=Flavobacterium jumunjinense TaxID=998845 RepID=A0ABV5GI03_9FLAO|nr:MULTISPECIES: hypothetical protein [Flavobacterium]